MGRRPKNPEDATPLTTLTRDFALAFPLLNTPRASRGRPRDDWNPDKRSSQISTVWVWITGQVTTRQAMAMAGIKERTLFDWRTRLLGDMQPDTDHLRRFMRQKERSGN